MRADQSSILDLVIVTEDIVGKILSWEVLEDESLSDHRYILTAIGTPKKTMQLIKCRGWNLKKLNAEKMEEAIAQIDENENTTSSEGFSQILVDISNKAMPRKRLLKGKRPVYWWTEEVARIRKECLRRRRIHTRGVKRDSAQTRQQKWDEYMDWKHRLQRGIKKSKSEAWKAICGDVDRDIWGNGYKIVMKRMTGFPPKVKLSMPFTKKIASQLFPTHDPVEFQCDANAEFVPFTESELLTATNRVKSNKAPGPGRILPEVLKKVAQLRPNYVLSVYNRLAKDGHFPRQWKKATLILLRKGNKPIDRPTSFRPVCLLDAEGKLYEQLLLGRLRDELKKNGDLSDKQYGFREGRQTVDAIMRVVSHAREAGNYSCRNRRFFAVITLDVRNAFNSVPWQVILDATRKKGIKEGLIKILASYLSERCIQLEAEDETDVVPISSGIPQGSVIGPILWNIPYDELLEEVKLPDGVSLVGFEDDIALEVTAEAKRC